MPNGDPMTTPAGLPKLPSMPPTITEQVITQKEKKPNKFLKVLGGIAGGAANIIAPGVGTMIGSLIGGGGSPFGSYGPLLEQQRQFEQMRRYNTVANMMQQQQQQTMMQQQQKQSFQLISMQTKVAQQSQEFSTISNLLKTRHDSEMTAVNNIKS